MERDDDLQPWLRGLDQQALAQIAIDLTYGICRPSFGSLSKRELEQLTFRLLYEHRGPDWATLGEIADDLAISRTKARNLVLEYRARQTGAMKRGERLKLLRTEVLSWPKRHVGEKGGELRVVVDDPFIRDLLKNFAYGRGILLDHSFSGEILTFNWDAYGQLLAGVYESAGGVSKEDAVTIGAGLRQQIVDGAAVTKLQQAILDKHLADLDKDVKKLVATNAEQRVALAKALGARYGLQWSGHCSKRSPSDFRQPVSTRALAGTVRPRRGSLRQPRGPVTIAIASRAAGFARSRNRTYAGSMTARRSHRRGSEVERRAPERDLSLDRADEGDEWSIARARMPPPGGGAPHPVRAPKQPTPPELDRLALPAGLPPWSAGA